MNTCTFNENPLSILLCQHFHFCMYWIGLSPIQEVESQGRIAPHLFKNKYKYIINMRLVCYVSDDIETLLDGNVDLSFTGKTTTRTVPDVPV